jgi:hypothetical protein
MRTLLFTTIALGIAGMATAQPIDSDLADARQGGGCYTTALQPSILDMLTLINPEWAPVMSGQTVDSDPVLISGTVQQMHGDTGGDFPSTHALADVVMDVIVDPEHEDKVATGNDEEHEIAFEWEAGAYPDWAWPGFGDHIYGLGRHIFDCGHPAPRPGHCSVSTARECVLDVDCRDPICSGCGSMQTCEGEHFGFSSELHPPHATAVIRQGRGAQLAKRPTAPARPATIADIWVSADGGGAGDRCVLTHLPSDAAQLSLDCWPLVQPVAKINARDFTFTVPLPPRPRGARRPRWRVVAPSGSTDKTAVDGGRPARLRVRKRLADPTPSLEVTVRMTKKVRGSLPTGFAGRLVAGWNGKATPLTHVRVTVSEIDVRNALQRKTPLIPRTCSVSDTPCETAAECPVGESCWGQGPVKGWRGQVAANGEWRRFSGAALDDVVDGSTVTQPIVFDQFLPADGSLRIQADAFARECIQTAYGQSLADGLARLGLTKGIACLGGEEAHAAGKIDVTYQAPTFGAGTSGAETYTTPSTGGEGGTCSSTTSMLCVVDGDCPVPQTCVTTGGAFQLRYTIEALP